MNHKDTETLPQLPDLGFYYHYKHDPMGSVNNYAYEVIGIGYHTEDDCRPIDQYMVQYRPLYDAFVYRIGKGRINDARPLSMFMEHVTRDGKITPRFQKIIDPRILEELRIIRNEMYSDLAK